MAQPAIHAPRLDQKVALVTGSSSGLGRAIALAYASHGTRLVVCADLQSEPKPGIDGEVTPTHEEICQKYGADKAVYVRCDVGKTEDVKNAVATAVQKGGRLDIIVNNAGVGVADRNVRLHEQSEEHWETVMRINSTGIFHGCKHALQQFLSQPPHTSGHRGWIVNISSIFGIAGNACGAGPYCASKGACMNLTRQIAADYARDKIHSNALCPGFLKTAMTRTTYEDDAVGEALMNMTPWKEFGDVRDVARGAVVLASEDANFCTGIGLPVDGGYLCQ